MANPTPDRQPYSYDWLGNCDPATYKPLCGRFSAFSVACFQWLPKAKGGLKRGRCVVRVFGPTSRPDLVYSKATEICNQLNAGTYAGPKNVRA
jgi:hypothetical protein